jgi:hypothetical protein
VEIDLATFSPDTVIPDRPDLGLDRHFWVHHARILLEKTVEEVAAKGGRWDDVANALDQEVAKFGREKDREGVSVALTAREAVADRHYRATLDKPEGRE